MTHREITLPESLGGPHQVPDMLVTIAALRDWKRNRERMDIHDNQQLDDAIELLTRCGKEHDD